MTRSDPRFVLSLTTAVLLHAIVLVGWRTDPVTPEMAPAKLTLRFSALPTGEVAPSSVSAPSTPSTITTSVAAEKPTEAAPVVPPVEQNLAGRHSEIRQTHEPALRGAPAKPTPPPTPASRTTKQPIAKTAVVPVEAAPTQLAHSESPAESALAAEIAGASVRYEQTLAAWLDRHKYYPATLRRRRLEGEGVLRVELDRSGRVVALETFAALPDDLLERVAKDWVRRSDPFPAMPDEIPGEAYSVRFPVRFALD